MSPRSLPVMFEMPPSCARMASPSGSRHFHPHVPSKHLAVTRKTRRGNRHTTRAYRFRRQHADKLEEAQHNVVGRYLLRRRREEPNSFSDRPITVLAEDPAPRLWISERGRRLRLVSQRRQLEQFAPSAQEIAQSEPLQSTPLGEHRGMPTSTAPFDLP